MSRTKRRLFLRVLPFLLMGASWLAVEVVVGGPIAHLCCRPSRAEFEALRAEGESIVRALDVYRRTHGRYPASLPGSLRVSHAVRYGGWRYACGPDCATFTLAAGDYLDHYFEIHWRFASKTWYIDS